MDNHEEDQLEEFFEPQLMSEDQNLSTLEDQPVSESVSAEVNDTSTPVASTSQVSYTKDKAITKNQVSEKKSQHCKKVFSRAFNCARHIRSHHNIDDQYKRFKCGFRNYPSDFTRPDDRIRHHRHCHGIVEPGFKPRPKKK